MFERFTHEARQVVKGAEAEARSLASPTIEAEHLLLVLARDDATLTAAGLDHDGVLEALAAERERSLAAVGVSLSDFALPPAAPAPKPRFAASARSALARALREAVDRGDKRITGGHILLAVLHPQLGTVPRALARADVDRDGLRARIAAAMDL